MLDHRNTPSTAGVGIADRNRRAGHRREQQHAVLVDGLRGRDGVDRGGVNVAALDGQDIGIALDATGTAGTEDVGVREVGARAVLLAADAVAAPPPTDTAATATMTPAMPGSPSCCSPFRSLRRTPRRSPTSSCSGFPCRAILASGIARVWAQ